MPEIITDPRLRLIRAAEQEFRRFGYRKATVEEMTRAADTGKGSFYLHFPSKEDAYLAVVEASLQRFLEKASAALSSTEPVPSRLRRLVATTAEHYGSDELLRASLFGEASLVDGRVARRAAEIQRSQIRELLAETLRQGMAEGSVRSTLDVEATAGILFEVGWAVVRAELEGTTDIPLAQALDTLNEMVGKGIMNRPSR